MPEFVEILYTLRTENFPRRLWERGFNSLPPACRRYILNFHRPADRHDRLLARLLLRHLLQTRFGFTADCLERIRLDENRRPFINREIDFNISHSGGLVICAVAENLRLGIDVEKIAPVNLADYATFLSRDEYRKLQSAAAPEKEFFAFWTTRESLLKADGHGLPLETELHQAPDNACFIASRQYFATRLDLPPGYVGHLAADHATSRPRCREIPLTDLQILSP